MAPSMMTMRSRRRRTRAWARSPGLETVVTA